MGRVERKEWPMIERKEMTELQEDQALDREQLAGGEVVCQVRQATIPSSYVYILWSWATSRISTLDSSF